MEVNHKKEQEEELCLSCGLCCDGSIFTVIPLSQNKILSGKNQVPLHDISRQKSNFLEQPCSHYIGNSCSIYHDPSKPHVCSQFKCRLLFELKNKTASRSECLSIIRDAKNQIRGIRETLKSGGFHDSSVSLELNVKTFQNENLNISTLSPILKFKAYKLFLQRYFGIFQLNHKKVRSWRDRVVEFKLKFLRTLILFLEKTD